MGRTRRTRRRKQMRLEEQEGEPLGPEMANLVRWMKREGGWDRRSFGCPKLKLFNFSRTTGRGIMTSEDVQGSCLIVSVPMKLIITRSTAEQKLHPKDSRQMTTQEVLTLFLLLESSKLESLWTPYFETMPKSYSVPYFCRKDEIRQFPLYLRSRCEEQVARVDRAYNKLLGNAADGAEADQRAFSVAWFSVNSRAVYFETCPPLVVGPLCEHHLALAPFLDMFNHSDDVAVTAGVKDRNFYQISTKTSCGRGRQLFINYGPHSNIKLYVEYGFVVSQNSNDYFPVELADVAEACSSLTFDSPEGKVSGTKMREGKAFDIIRSNRFDQNLRIDEVNGISWNLGASIFILLYFSGRSGGRKRSHSWHEVFHCSDFLASEAVRTTARNLIVSKSLEVEDSLSSLSRRRERTPSCDVAMDLLKIHLNTLKTALLLLDLN